MTGSMTPIIDQVKANALRFYDDVQANLTAKGKHIDPFRVRVIAFRDFAADGDAALQESPFFTLPEERAVFWISSTGCSPKAAGTPRSPGWRPSPWRSIRRGRRPAIVAGR